MHENPRIFVSSYTLRKCSKTVDFIHFRRYNTNGNRVIFFQYFIRFLKLYESIGEYKMREKIENFIAMSGATLLIAVGTYFFKFPNNFTFGGITGLAVLIAKTGLISAADFSFVVISNTGRWNLYHLFLFPFLCSSCNITLIISTVKR